MKIELELSDDHKKVVLGIVKKHYPEYNNIHINLDNIVHCYKNYKPYQGWEDYSLNYDDHFKIHWFEFMILILKVDDDEMGRIFLKEIFVNNIHPVDAYKEMIKDKNKNN